MHNLSQSDICQQCYSLVLISGVLDICFARQRGGSSDHRSSDVLEPGNTESHRHQCTEVIRDLDRFEKKT